jgi:nitrogen regulatory protein PII-like uncharacterized protein
MEIDLLKLNYTDVINVDTDVNYTDDYIAGSGIIHLNNVHVKGTIKSDLEFNYDVLFDLSGEMIIIDSLSGEEVPYKFSTNIEEKLENSLKSLDLIGFLWQYIVIEIPMRFTLCNDLSVKKDDYEVISEEEYKEKKNNPFKDFHLE